MQKKASISGRNLNDAITSDDLLGKKVIDLEGKVVGIIEKVLIDSKNLEFIGIEVDKGFLKKGLSIGKSYIGKISENSVFLKIKVVFEIKGMTVFDEIGAKVGKITGVELWGEKNKIKKIYVKQGLIKKDLAIPAEIIETIGQNVILKIKKEKLRKLLSKQGSN